MEFSLRIVVLAVIFTSVGQSDEWCQEQHDRLLFTCLVCMHDEHIIRGQLGGRSLVETSCPASHVFHLECITRWLDEQIERGLDQRECVCGGPALPLIRMDGIKLLDDESP